MQRPQGITNYPKNGIDNPASHLQGNMRTRVIGENDAMGAQDQWSVNYYDDKFKDINRNIVTSKINNNGQVEHAQPQTGSLTVKKEVFGCETQGNLDCHDTDIESPDWLSYDNSPITSGEFCNLIRDNLDMFDIKVLDYQNNPIQTITGSRQGTTLQDLETSSFMVNERRYQNGNYNQLQ